MAETSIELNERVPSKANKRWINVSNLPKMLPKSPLSLLLYIIYIFGPYNFNSAV